MTSFDLSAVLPIAETYQAQIIAQLGSDAVPFCAALQSLLKDPK